MSDLKLSKQYSVYQPKDESVFPVPVSDWNRLKGRITRMCPSRRIYQTISSLCSGVCISSIFSLIAFYGVPSGLAPWVLPTSWAVLVTSAVLSIMLLILDGQQKTIIEESITSVIEDMRALEEKHKTE